MRVDWSPRLPGTSGRRDARGASSGRAFAVSVAGEIETKPAAASASAGAVDGLLALQEVADETAGHRRAAARGGALLDRLEDLRLGLLVGSLPRAQLAELRLLARDHGSVSDDPRLAEVLSEIDLRVAVELAKLDALV